MITVLSDTHYNTGFSLPGKILELISKSRYVVHCGDFVSTEFYNFMKSSHKLIAVKGNNDHALSDVLETEEQFSCGGIKFAVTHGHLIKKNDLHYAFPEADVILYGHHHHPEISFLGDKMILSPGSLTANRYVDYNSYMTIELNNGEKPVVEILKAYSG